MQLSDFSYDLPPDLIAEKPLPERTHSRLLSLNKQTGEILHTQFSDLARFFGPGDVLVLNDTRVLAARCFARKSTGAKVEVLFEREMNAQTALVQTKTNHRLKIGETLIFSEDTTGVVIERVDRFFVVRLTGSTWIALA